LGPLRLHQPDSGFSALRGSASAYYTFSFSTPFRLMRRASACAVAAAAIAGGCFEVGPEHDGC
jgi:hypothetical protein